MSMKADERAELRRGRYKLAVDAEEGRRRREDSMVKIRKSKREEGLLKKRSEVTTEAAMDTSFSEDSPIERMRPLPEMVSAVYSNDVALQLEATKLFRKLLGSEEDPPISAVLKCDVIPRFVEFLTRDDVPELQRQAAWALTLVASGTSEHTRVVINSGAIPLFVKLLHSPFDALREQAVWALGNIAGDSPPSRDIVLGHGALPSLLSIFAEITGSSIQKTATWTLSNICRGRPQPPFEMKKAILCMLGSLINSDDEEIITDACWALSFLSDGNPVEVQTVIDARVCPRIVAILTNASDSLTLPALRVVANVAASDVHLHLQVIPSLLSVLSRSSSKSIKKEACWVISTITAGSAEQIQVVINAGAIPLLIHLMKAGEFEIKSEAAWAISGVAFGGTPEQINYMVHQGCIGPVCDLLECPNSDLVLLCLDCLSKILRVGENVAAEDGVNVAAQMMEDCEGLDKIESLQAHDNPKIYEKAVEILERYWSIDDADSPSSVVHE